MIYKQVTDIIINTLKRFKGVNYVRYTGDDLINQQHNYNTIQCWIDNITHTEFNISSNIAKASYEIYILGFPNNEDEILDIQDKCYDIALYTLAYIDNNREWSDIISVYDYSILTLSRYTSQSNAGVKLSLVLNIPNGVNFCELDNYFNDEPYKEKEENEITINKDEVGRIDLKPIRLKPNC